MTALQLAHCPPSLGLREGPAPGRALEHTLRSQTIGRVAICKEVILWFLVVAAPDETGLGTGVIAGCGTAGMARDTVSLILETLLQASDLQREAPDPWGEEEPSFRHAVAADPEPAYSQPAGEAWPTGH